MSYFLKIVFVSFYIVGLSSSDEDLEDRIISGQIVQARNYPYYVFLKADTKICGGALIGPRTVLTAARCVENRKNITAYTGFNNINQKGPFYSADPNYYNKSYYNLALLRLNQSVLRRDVQPIPLAEKPPKLRCEVGIVGYGAFRCNPAKENCDKPSNRLRFTKTIVKDYWFPWLVAENNNGRSVCTGDAGGPVFYNNTLVAIISHSQPDCTGLNYFVRVDAQSKVFSFGKRPVHAAYLGIGRSKGPLPEEEDEENQHDNEHEDDNIDFDSEELTEGRYPE